MEAWKHFIAIQRKELGEQVIKKWIEPLKVIKFDARNLYLEAQDMFHAAWFDEHLREKAGKLLVNNNKKPIKVHIDFPGNSPKEKKTAKKSKKGIESPEAPFKIDFEELDPYCTFSHFHVSDANNVTCRIFAHIAGDDDVDNAKLLDNFNPIYVYGGKGAGKTHLLMATAQALRDRGLNVIYVRTQFFADHVVSAIRSAEMSAFREIYRNSDVLIVDDVHVLSRKSTTQEEFFHTFNALHSDGKQIILGANCVPSELSHIEPRLVSRFEWGIVLSLDVPSRDDQLIILNAKTAALDFPLHAKVKDFLIDSFSTSTSLNKAVEALVLRSHLNPSRNLQALTSEVVQELLSDLLEEEKEALMTPDRITQNVAEHFGILQKDILGKLQTRECVLPRQIAMHLCRYQLKLPYMRIGEIFGRDHSTVMSSVRLIQTAIEADDKEINGAYRSIMRKMNRV